MSFGGPLPTLTSPVKVDHVFLLCFCLNSQHWTLESFGRSCFSAFKSSLFHFVPQAIWCVLPGMMPSVFPPPLPLLPRPPLPPQRLFFFVLSLFSFFFSFSFSSFFLTSLHSLPFHHSFHPFLSLPQSLPPFPLQIDEVKNVRWRTSGGVMIYFDRFG